jgi:nicotinamidase/pyrazinamidase
MRAGASAGMTMTPETEYAAFIAIDVQNDFCPGGALAVERGHEVVAHVNRLMPRFGVRVLTQDWHPADHRSFAASHAGAAPFSTTQMHYGSQVLWPVHCVQGTLGADFHPELDTDAADLILRKGFRSAIDSYSAFFENDRTTTTGLAGYLRERGVEARLGFSVTVVEDACRAIDLDGSLDTALAQMRTQGVRLVTSAAVAG